MLQFLIIYVILVVLMNMLSRLLNVETSYLTVHEAVK